MNVYYDFMLNKKKYNTNFFHYNNYIISKYKSSSYITNTINNLKGSNFNYNIFISIVKGIFYGFITFIIDDIISKVLNKE